MLAQSRPTSHAGTTDARLAVRTTRLAVAARISSAGQKAAASPSGHHRSGGNARNRRSAERRTGDGDAASGEYRTSDPTFSLDGE